MKRQKMHSSQRNEIADLLRRIQDYRPAKGEFNYTERGRAITEAHCLYKESHQLSRRFPMDADLSEASSAAHRLWFAALDAAYPQRFWDDVEKLRAGDAAGLESAISFLEADPIFFRTGYVKVHLVRYIKPPMLTPNDVRRLQVVVLAKVEKLIGQDFSTFCRLAKKVDGPVLREGLTQRLTSSDANISRRARWVLEALIQKDRMDRTKKPQE